MNWKGRQFKGEYIEFGEHVVYLAPGTRGKDKFESRWNRGIWYGMIDRTEKQSLEPRVVLSSFVTSNHWKNPRLRILNISTILGEFHGSQY